MKKSVRNARIIQLIGACSLIGGIVSCSNGALTDAPMQTGWFFMVGLILVIGTKIYEFLVRE